LGPFLGPGVLEFVEWAGDASASFVYELGLSVSGTRELSDAGIAGGQSVFSQVDLTSGSDLAPGLFRYIAGASHVRRLWVEQFLVGGALWINGRFRATAGVASGRWLFQGVFEEVQRNAVKVGRVMVDGGIE